MDIQQKWQQKIGTVHRDEATGNEDKDHSQSSCRILERRMRIRVRGNVKPSIGSPTGKAYSNTVMPVFATPPNLTAANILTSRDN